MEIVEEYDYDEDMRFFVVDEQSIINEWIEDAISTKS